MTATPPNVILPEKEEWGEIDLNDIQDIVTPTIFLENIFEKSFVKYLKNLSKASGIPVDYIVLNLLVMSSVIIGNKRTIYVRNGWTDEPVHLWGALVGNPSAKKTASMNIIQKAIKKLTAVRTLEYRTQKRAYDIAIKQYKANKLDYEPQKPVLRQLIVNDTTVEALHRVINQENPECLCVFRDELTGLIGALSKYNNGDRSFFLEGYNGNPYIINRAKFDEPIIIPRLSISVLGTIQPEKLEAIFSEADDGFLSRFLFSFPEAELSEEIRINVEEKRLGDIFEKLDRLSLSEENICLSEDAKRVFNQWHKENEIEIQRYVSGILQSSYGKMGGQAARLACVLEHIFWALSEEKEPPKTISQDTMLKAIVLIEDYFKPMIKKVLSKCTHSSKDNTFLSFVRYLADNKVQKFNVRALKRKSDFPIFDKYEEERFLSSLTKMNLIRQVNAGKPGRHSKDYIVNPKLMEMKL